MFHLSLTVMFSFRTLYSCVKLSMCFRILALSALFLRNILRLGRHLRLGEMLISITIVLWSATPSTTLASLHWLPIDSRIKYKLACICYNSMSTNSPPYLSDLLTVYTASRQLRSCSDNSVLRRPSVRTVSYGQRSFAYSAPSAWNALPQQVRSSDSVSTFRSRTKTHLFRLAY